jgi:hypothetical protein
MPEGVTPLTHPLWLWSVAEERAHGERALASLGTAHANELAAVAAAHAAALDKAQAVADAKEGRVSEVPTSTLRVSWLPTPMVCNVSCDATGRRALFRAACTVCSFCVPQLERALVAAEATQATASANWASERTSITQGPWEGTLNTLVSPHSCNVCCNTTVPRFVTPGPCAMYLCLAGSMQY